MLKEAMRTIIEQLRTCSEPGLEVSLKGRKVFRRFPKVMSYCCDILEAKAMFFIRH